MKTVAITTLAVLTAFIGSAIAADVIASQLGIWSTLVTGVIAAPVVVVVAHTTTKKRKILAASIAYVIGACASIYLLTSDYYPESYERAYEPTMIPLTSTLTSGAVALMALIIMKQKKEKNEA
jgi:Ni/Fe-hydrogenase subunit HybB-like protein